MSSYVKNSARPDVSVLVLAADDGRHLTRALESILGQRGVSFEVLVGDDASNDGSSALIESYRAQDDRLRFVRPATPIGRGELMRKLLERAEGRYVALLNASSAFVHGEVLSHAVERLDTEPKAALLHAAVECVDEHGARLNERWRYQQAHVARGARALIAFVSGHAPEFDTVVLRRHVARADGGPRREHGRAWFQPWVASACLHGDVVYEAHVSSVVIGDRPSQVSPAYRTKLALALEELRPRVVEHPLALRALDERVRLLMGPAPEPSNAQADATRLESALERWRRGHVRVAIFGAGQLARELLATHDFDELDLVGFCDRDPALQQTTLEGRPIVSFENLFALAPEAVLVASREFERPIVQALRLALPPRIEVVTIRGTRPLEDAETAQQD